MDNECMLYAGAISSKGYAQKNVKINGVWKNRQLHREMYITFKGDIPEKFVIDHLCRNRSCINPDHLEAVTNEENIRRGERPSYYTETCNNEHVLAEVGFSYMKGNRRRCLECNRIYWATYSKQILDKKKIRNREYYLKHKKATD